MSAARSQGSPPSGAITEANPQTATCAVGRHPPDVASTGAAHQGFDVNSLVVLHGDYGCLWWVAVNGNHYPNVELPDGGFSAWGAGGHMITEIPALNLVVVHRVNTDDPGKKVTLDQVGRLLHLILAARKQG